MLRPLHLGRVLRSSGLLPQANNGSTQLQVHTKALYVVEQNYALLVPHSLETLILNRFLKKAFEWIQTSSNLNYGPATYFHHWCVL